MSFYDEELEMYTYYDYEDMTMIAYHLAKENPIKHKDEVFKIIRRLYYEFLFKSGYCNSYDSVNEFIYEEPTYWEYRGYRRGFVLFEKIFGKDYELLKKDLLEVGYVLEQYLI